MAARIKPVRHYFRAHRINRGLTQAEVADRVSEKLPDGITPQSISRIEGGKQVYKSSLLEALADELTGGDIGALFRRPETDRAGR